MTTLALSIQNKNKQQRLFSKVTSVNGVPFEDLNTGLENKFDDVKDACKQITKATGRYAQNIKTTRVGISAYALRA